MTWVRGAHSSLAVSVDLCVILARMAELVVRLRDRELSRTPIRNTRVTLGRDLASDVVIDNPSVSRTHAILIYVDEKFRVRDGSANGMTINGKPSKDAVLSYGDVIGIGKFEVVLQQSAHDVPMQAGGGHEKNGAARQSAISALQDTLRPPPTKPAVADEPLSAPTEAAAATAPSPDVSAPQAAGDSEDHAAGQPIPVPPALAQAAANPAKKPRVRPKPFGVDVIAVAQLAGLGLLLIVGGLAVAWWMLENGKL
jgi:predicted component of type VI protein secretion system